jgi:hypothetical protein
MTTTKKAILIGCGLIVVVLGYFAVFGVRTTRVETIRRQVNQSVAIGASLSDVAHSLDAMQIEHSEIERPQMMLMSGHRYDNVLVVMAIQRNTWRSLLFREDVELIFVFDETRKLNRIDIFPILTGP